METRAVNSVYLWLSQLSSDEFEVMYVGKAGKGIKKRLKEHQNGFKRSPMGMKSANLIRQLLTQKKTLSIHTRECAEIQLFDFTINAYSADVKLAPDEKTATRIANDMVEKNFKKGWNKVVWVCSAWISS